MMLIHCPQCSLASNAHAMRPWDVVVGDLTAKLVDIPGAAPTVLWDGSLVCPCGHSFRLRDYLAGKCALPPTLDHPPNGVWVERRGEQVVLRAPTRSLIEVAVLLLVTLGWYWATGWWFLGTIASRARHGFEGVWALLIGDILFACGTLFLTSWTMLRAVGRIEVELAGGEGAVFVGVGGFGRVRRFRADAIRCVSMTHSRSLGRGQIVLEGDRNIVFGGLLNSVCRCFIFQVMRESLKLPGSIDVGV